MCDIKIDEQFWRNNCCRILSDGRNGRQSLDAEFLMPSTKAAMVT